MGDKRIPLSSRDDELNIKDIARWLRIPESRLYGLCRRGMLPGVKKGRQWRFQEHQIELWLVQQVLEVGRAPEERTEKGPPLLPGALPVRGRASGPEVDDL